MFDSLYEFWVDWRAWVYTDIVAYCFVCMLAGVFTMMSFVYAKDLFDALRAKKR